MSFIIAAAQYPIDELSSWEDYVRKLDLWLGDAVRNGASLAMFPEYGAMELASLDPRTRGDLSESLEYVASLTPRIDELHSDLARKHGIYILGSSAPVRRGDGRIVNRSRLFGPSGRFGWQDKCVMTRFERETWGISAGDRLTVFDTRLGRIGILICYDVEFPLLARRLCEAGADLLLAPSCTDTLHGYWRVRLACQARALENQRFVAQSVTVGDASWSPAVDVNRGAAGIFGPPDGEFPDDGVCRIGTPDQPGWISGRINVEMTSRLQRQGAVLNFRDWSDTEKSPLLKAVEQTLV